MQQKILCHDGVCVDITSLSRKDLDDYLTLLEEYEIMEI